MNRNIFEIMKFRKKVAKLSALAFIGAVSMLGISRVSHAMKPGLDSGHVAVSKEMTAESQQMTGDSVLRIEHEYVGDVNPAKEHKKTGVIVVDDSSTEDEKEVLTVEDDREYIVVDSSSDSDCELEQTRDYELGLDFYRKRDYTRAIEHFLCAANAGSKKAHYYLGWCYLAEEAEEKNEKMAEEHFRKVIPFVCERRDAESLFMYGRLLLSEKREELGLTLDKKAGLDLIRKAAEQGYAPAQFELGVYYTVGRKLEKDYAESTKWLKLSVAQKYAPALCLLGRCYEMGWGMEEPDLYEAVKCYRLAAAQGNTFAKSSLERCFSAKQQKDIKRSEWYELLIEKGYTDALYVLGLCYEHSRGVSRDYAKAEKLIGQAADKGHKQARVWLANRAKKASISEKGHKRFGVIKAVPGGDRSTSLIPEKKKFRLE